MDVRVRPQLIDQVDQSVHAGGAGELVPPLTEHGGDARRRTRTILIDARPLRSCPGRRPAADPKSSPWCPRWPCAAPRRTRTWVLVRLNLLLGFSCLIVRRSRRLLA